MPPIDGRARLLQSLEVGDDLVERDTLKVGHVSPPGAAVVEATPGKVYTKTIQGAKRCSLPRLPISTRWPWLCTLAEEPNSARVPGSLLEGYEVEDHTDLVNGWPRVLVRRDNGR